MKQDIITTLIRSLENREILLKRTTLKINSQEGGLLNFLGPLMRIGLPLMKNLLTPLGKRVLVPWRVTLAGSATNADFLKKIFGSGKTTLII